VLLVSIGLLRRVLSGVPLYEATQLGHLFISMINHHLSLLCAQHFLLFYFFSPPSFLSVLPSYGMSGRCKATVCVCVCVSLHRWCCIMSDWFRVFRSVVFGAETVWRWPTWALRSVPSTTQQIWLFIHVHVAILPPAVSCVQTVFASRMLGFVK